MRIFWNRDGRVTPFAQIVTIAVLGITALGIGLVCIEVLSWLVARF